MICWYKWKFDRHIPKDVKFVLRFDPLGGGWAALLHLGIIE